MSAERDLNTAWSGKSAKERFSVLKRLRQRKKDGQLAILERQQREQRQFATETGWVLKKVSSILGKSDISQMSLEQAIKIDDVLSDFKNKHLKKIKANGLSPEVDDRLADLHEVAVTIIEQAKSELKSEFDSLIKGPASDINALVGLIHNSLLLPYIDGISPLFNDILSKCRELGQTKKQNKSYKTKLHELVILLGLVQKDFGYYEKAILTLAAALAFFLAENDSTGIIATASAMADIYEKLAKLPGKGGLSSMAVVLRRTVETTAVAAKATAVASQKPKPATPVPTQ